MAALALSGDSIRIDDPIFAKKEEKACYPPLEQKETV